MKMERWRSEKKKKICNQKKTRNRTRVTREKVAKKNRFTNIRKRGKN